MDDNDIFKNVAGILQESLYLYETEGDFTALFNQPLDEGQVMRVITLASAACLDVLRSFNGSESEPLCDVLWHLVPRSIDMLLAQVDEQNVIVITKLAAIAESLLSQNIILPSDDEVSWALHNMVAATLQCVPFTDQINIIASCVSAICTATQDLELLYTSDLVNSLADSLVNSNNHTLCKAMFNVSFLLARNNAATPWLSDFDTIQYDDSHFEKHILSICPPVFYKWFLKHFPEPIQWLASRTRYVKTLAVMSIVGYVVGGDTVHVDLNLVFGKGEDLSVPERVPFRLTQNLTHAMGVLESAGLYTKTCEVAMTVLLRNKQSLLGVFQTLLNELDAADSASQKH
ncbi:hypothetical protein MUCCIDRAFT_163567 [Mucor lusitanicus CBS 277.49]|uniref:PI3K/PI4K catalytic domain-containing protein n=1 Tax=Mucor lusitanicus CBS 277.49 TaxID=747725 RepID=A0A162QLW4_MUCCL|nr:hypothetical protein MUCCIDRAFT_163567 [Mucor lusitanicus CBS 277.49]